jgi:hypothetical protein
MCSAMRMDVGRGFNIQSYGSIVHSHSLIPSRLAFPSTRASVLPCGGRKHVGRVPIATSIAL